jgi:hypothetical protein
MSCAKANARKSILPDSVMVVFNKGKLTLEGRANYLMKPIPVMITDSTPGAFSSLLAVLQQCYPWAPFALLFHRDSPEQIATQIPLLGSLRSGRGT